MTRAATQPRAAPRTSPYPSLFDAPDPITQACIEFDRLHPGIYERFKAIVQERRNAGVKRLTSKWVVETIRMEEPRDGRGRRIQINNNFSSVWARRLASEIPALGEMFEFRQRKTGSQQEPIEP